MSAFTCDAGVSVLSVPAEDPRVADVDGDAHLKHILADGFDCTMYVLPAVQIARKDHVGGICVLNNPFV